MSGLVTWRTSESPGCVARSLTRLNKGLRLCLALGLWTSGLALPAGAIDLHRDLAVMSAKKPAVPPLAHARFCLRHPGQCAPIPAKRSRHISSAKPFSELQRINLLVNRSIEPQRDRMDRGLADRWSLGGRRGDCEDYALLKRKRLLDLGWSSRDLRIATALTPEGIGDAVLVVRLEGQDLVLDNKTGAIHLWSQTGYRFLKVQSELDPRAWMSVAPHPVGSGA
jgi:predicted transglutaminase-like cysteine proteinase